jgi:predicted alpha/beta-hydrolase family hydrolase
MDTPFMQAIAQGLAARDINVVRFEFAFMEARRHGKRPGPDRMPALAARFSELVQKLALKRVFVGGKSLGSRVAAQVADALGAAGVIALGYPFHPPRRPDTLRVAALAALRTRCLIVHGTRDPFGSPTEIASYALPDSVTVRFVEDGDHDLMPRKASGRTHAQNLAEAVAHMEAFMCDEARPRRVRK